MEWVKIRLEQIKTQLDQLQAKYDKKTLQRFVGLGILIVVVAIGIAYYANVGSYEVLFSAVPESEAANITARLQSDGINYQHTEEGDILVPKDVADQTRATLVIEGYPSSGFAYETYLENAGGMTTTSQEEEYKRIALEQKIESTIGLFDGVRKAVVSISLSEDNKYVLQGDSNQNNASASVAVELDPGARLSDDQVEGIQRLVAASVQNLEMENVVVVDGSGIEISSSKDSQNTESDAQSELKEMENALATKIANALEPIYGSGNFRVSVTGVLNQDKGISESITYTVPDGLVEEDGKGILTNESGDISLNGEGITGGVAGTEGNAEIPQYNVGEDGELDSYDESYIKDYLVNQTTEQKEVYQNVLEDVRVAVSLNSDTAPESVTSNELLNLIGQAAGITSLEREERITVVTAPFYDPDAGIVEVGFDALMSSLTTTQILIIAAVAFLIILLLLLTILSSRSKKKKRLAAEAAELAEAAEATRLLSLEEEKAHQIEAFNANNEKSNEVRNSIRDFADENPEISAQMIKSWLNGK